MTSSLRLTTPSLTSTNFSGSQHLLLYLKHLKAKKKNWRKSKGVSDLDSKHGNPKPNPQPDHSSSGSQSSVGDLNDF
jgi:hypothetical protein